jgi:hypothetical protein
VSHYQWGQQFFIFKWDNNYLIIKNILNVSKKIKLNKQFFFFLNIRI